MWHHSCKRTEYITGESVNLNMLQWFLVLKHYYILGSRNVYVVYILSGSKSNNFSIVATWIDNMNKKKVKFQFPISFCVFNLSVNTA